MDIYELVDKVDGEIVLGRARYRDENGKIVELGRSNGESMVFTEAGQRLVRLFDSVSSPGRQKVVRRRPQQPTPVSVEPSDDE